ncbi:Outer membrane protein beta-barrel domain-containing protein [Chryseobacterium piscicola]|uniref:Outer membrane protein beta-barrel domain-containing protein n=3 Tax=Chryseobacterium piscicola TaxID=551459 RepID=A0A1N7PDT2_9FLAO|nr:Outer membrane protein beta-barrel domain-containing protein [Chryseobacterium piscicola]
MLLHHFLNKKEILTKMKCTNTSKSIEKKLLNALFLLLSIFAFSQDYHLKFGVKAGWNYSNVNAIDDKGEPSGYLSNGGELYGGIVLEKQISEKAYIQSGFIASYTDAITFIELPVLYKYNFYKNFSVIAGPKINYIPDDETSQPYNFKRRFGISVDLGIDFKISNHFTAEGIFSKGLTEQYDDLILTYYDARRDVYRLGIIYYF